MCGTPASRSSTVATGHPLELGQRDHALLHAAAARGDERDQRDAPLARQAVGVLQAVAGPFAQRAAEEPELEGEDDAGPAADGRRAVEDGLLLARTGRRTRA
jgi:hypothetical protein